jgi:hypothetical protein
VLEPLARNSRYWRVLDPWLRLALLSGDAAESGRVAAQLSADGYVPLFPWPPSAASAASAAAAPDRSVSTPPRPRRQP